MRTTAAKTYIQRRRAAQRASGEVWTRANLWQILPHVCFVCRCEIANLEDASAEHKVPISDDGTETLGNMALSHRACNHARKHGASTLMERIAAERQRQQQQNEGA